VTRLIVEDGGERRAFKVSDGLLSVGSGASAKLRLSSEGVADQHVELGVEEGRVMLRPLPGVVPPKVGGVPVKGPVELKHQVPVQIGGARLTVEYEGAPPAEAGGKAVPRPGAVVRSGRAGARRTPRGPEEDEEPGRYRKKRSNTAWISLAIFAGAVAALGLFVVVMGPKLLGEAPPVFEPALHINRAREYVESADYTEALAELDRIPVGKVVIGPGLQRQIDELRADIEAGEARRAKTIHNLRGNPYLQTQLKNFEQNYLQGSPDPSRVRVFVKRLDHFAEEWPEHPEIDWVRRMRERYAAVIDLDAPPTFEDVAFEVETLTWADPRQFGEALEVLDDFIASAGPDDRAKALELYDQKLADRDEWFQDKLQQARWEYERDELGKSLAWLIRIVIYTGDDVMAETAAQEIVKFPDLTERLRGYRSQAPERFDQLAAQPTIRAYLREHPLDD